MKAFRSLLAVPFAILTLSATALFASDYSGWSSYRNVTVNTSTLGLTSNVTKIPLLVRLSAATQADMLNSGTQILANGADIRVTKSNGTTDLPFEIVSATTGSTGAVELWVLADTVLQNNANAYSFRIYWGKTGATTLSNSAAVFAPSNGFTAVWHFTTLNDATGNGYTLTPSTSAPTDAATGDAIIGNSKTFAVANAQFYNISDTNNSTPSGNTLNLNTNNGPYTVTAWAKPITCAAARMIVIGKYDGNSDPATRQWAIQTKSTAANWGFTNDPNLPAFTGATSGQEYTGDVTGSCVANTVVYMAGTYSLTGTPVVGATDSTGAGSLKFYLNGGAAATPGTGAVATGSQIGTTALPFIGKGSGTANQRYMNGTLDEITVSNVARSADWLALSYQTQQATVTALTVGTTTAQTVPGAPISVVGSAGNAQVTVSWSAPTTGGTVAGYTATSVQDTSKHCTTTGALTCAVTGLTNGTAYSFTVVATNGMGNSPASSASTPVTPTSGITPPTAPTAVSAVAGSARATVSWTASTANGSPITGYIATSNPGGLTCTTTSTSCVDSTLTNGTAYTFTVVATSGAGNSPTSAISNSVTPSGVPGAPTIGTVVSGNAQVTVNWTAPASNGGSAITGYTATAVSDTSKHCTVSGSTTLTCTVTGLTNGTAYTFTVKAANANGSSVASAASASVTPATVPGAPAITGAVGASGQVTVTWTAPTSTGGSAITGYTVTASDTSKHCTTTTALTCAVTGLTNTTAYTFTVVASNAVGKGAASPTSSSVTGILSRFAQNNFELQVTGSSVVFHLPAGITDAHISVKALNGREVWNKSIDGSSNEITWNGKTTSGSNAAGVYLIRLIQGDRNPKILAESKITLTP